MWEDNILNNYQNINNFNLSLMFQDYLVHIIDSRDLSINPEQVCSLFGNIEQIYEFNR